VKCHPWSGGLSSCALALPLSLVPRADASAPRGARSSAPASRRTDDLARLALLSLLRRFAPACARRPRIRSGWPGASVAATSGLSSPVLTVNSIISAHFQIFFCHRRARIPVYTRGLAIESLPFPSGRGCGPHHALTPAKTERRTGPPWRMPLDPAPHAHAMIAACAGRSLLDPGKRAPQDIRWASRREGDDRSTTHVGEELRLGHMITCAQIGAHF
jgi:hypothetical protein